MCLAETNLHEHSHDHDHDHAPMSLGRRAMLVGGAAAAAAAAMPSPAQADGMRRVRDLTHTLTHGFPVYTFDNPVRETLTTIPANGFYAQQWTLAEHAGTHIDAPGHFATGGRLLPEITAAELILPVVVVDVSDRVAGEPDTEVTVEDLRRFEHRHGRIPRGAAVLMHSGWESRLPLGQAAYRGQDANGGYHFPGFGAEAVHWLIEHRGITCVGTDTLSLDPGRSSTFQVHNLLLGADRYGLENVAHLADIPPRGATLYVGAIPLEDGSGGPCRLLATW